MKGTQIPLLNAGDAIGIVSASYWADEQSLNTGVEIIKSRGFRPEFYKTHPRKFFKFAGTDQQRLEELQFFLDDASCKAIFFARGGYGLTRIIDKLNWEKFITNPKWLIGFSDVTAIHCEVLNRNLASVHGPNVNSLSKDKESTDFLFDFLTKGFIEYHFQSSSFSETRVEINGTLFGGNLSLLSSVLGTKSAPRVKQGILFLEDVGEYIYHIDRMLVQLERYEIFSQLNGILVGDFNDLMDTDPTFGISVKETLSDISKCNNIPVIFDFPAGHLKKNIPFVSGNYVKIIHSKNQISLFQKYDSKS